MVGPRTAVIPSRLASSDSMASTVASTTPDKAPFHPAWQAPTTPAAASANSTVPQSAPVTPSARPGVRVARPSQRGRSASVKGPVTITASGEWTRWGMTSRSAATPSVPAIRRRFSKTAARSSRELDPPLSEA